MDLSYSAEELAFRNEVRSWLDANLPGIVEEAVRKEVERISRNS